MYLDYSCQDYQLLWLTVQEGFAIQFYHHSLFVANDYNLLSCFAVPTKYIEVDLNLNVDTGSDNEVYFSQTIINYSTE